MTKKHIIPYSHQSIDEGDIQAVSEALRQDFITQGPLLQRFEDEIAEFCGARYAVAFSNGTSALHAACMAAGLKKNDEGIVPPISFAATANCLLYARAKPVFADVTQELPLLDPEDVLQKITPSTRVLIPVHFSGVAAPMEDLHALASERGIIIIEDACHALGARYQDSTGRWIRVGSCAHSQMSVFSFHPVKSITTGEGGIVTTNDENLFSKLKSVRHHGITVPSKNENKPAWHYEINTLGFNYRLTDFQAALGLSQLKKIDVFRSKRRNLFERYAVQLEDINGLSLLKPPQKADPSFHLAVVLVGAPYSRDDLFEYLRTCGIGVQLHYIPIYRHPFYKKLLNINPNSYPLSEAYFNGALSLPLYPDLSDQDQTYVIEALKSWFSKKCGPHDGVMK